MSAPTHVTFAGFIYLLILTTTGIPLSVLNASVIGLSSLLPDIDNATSSVGRVVPFVSRRIERRFGHRTLTHSLPFMAGLSMVIFPLYAHSSPLYACVITGYASHPLLDTMTITGVKLFYPFSGVKCVFPFEIGSPHRYRVRTGSKTDRLLGVLFLLGCVPTFVVAYEGYERFVRSTQKNIEAAVRDFNEFSKDHLVIAGIEAYQAMTRQPLIGTVRIIGALNTRTLVFRGPDGRPHTLGKEFQADYIAEKIWCTRGSGAVSYVRSVDASDQILSQVLAVADTSTENYFFGDLFTADRVSLPENIRVFTPVTGGGGAIRLNFATLEDIRNYNLEYVYVTKGILTVKSISMAGKREAKDSAGSSVPGMQKFDQVSILLGPKESLTVLREKGDSVVDGQVLAMKDVDQFIFGEIGVDSEKILALMHQQETDSSDFAQKLLAAEEAVGIESTSHAHDLELFRNHYLSQPAIDESELRLNKERRLMSALVEGRSSHSRTRAIEIQTLWLRITELETKARSTRLLSELRSPVRGIIVDIRRIPREGKTMVTFIIRRTG